MAGTCFWPVLLLWTMQSFIACVGTDLSQCTAPDVLLREGSCRKPSRRDLGHVLSICWELWMDGLSVGSAVWRWIWKEPSCLGRCCTRLQKLSASKSFLKVEEAHVLLEDVERRWGGGRCHRPTDLRGMGLTNPISSGHIGSPWPSGSKRCLFSGCWEQVGRNSVSFVPGTSSIK